MRTPSRMLPCAPSSGTDTLDSRILVGSPVDGPEGNGPTADGPGDARGRRTGRSGVQQARPGDMRGKGNAMPRWKALPEELDPQIREFASQLRRLVDRSGLNINAVADRTGYSKTSWERYLNGRLLAPRGAVVALAEVTGTPQHHLTTMWELAERAWSRAEMRHDMTMEAIRITQARAALGELGTTAPGAPAAGRSSPAPAAAGVARPVPARPVPVRGSPQPRVRPARTPRPATPRAMARTAAGPTSPATTTRASSSSPPSAAPHRPPPTTRTGRTTACRTRAGGDRSRTRRRTPTAAPAPAATRALPDRARPPEAARRASCSPSGPSAR